ncbi:MAG: hypothetical protein R3D32_09025 [Nitratireductor sp.]
MKLEILDHISDPGHKNKPNDDALVFTDRMAAVLDGATGLADTLIFTGEDSDAAWLARFAARMLGGLEGDFSEMVQVINIAARDAVGACADVAALPRFAWPTCCFEMVRIRDTRLEIGGLGDCVAYLDLAGKGEIIRHSGLAVARLGETAAARRMLDAAGGFGVEGSIVHSGEALAKLRKARSLSNTAQSGVWTLGLVEEAAGHVKVIEAAVQPGDMFLLMSDGFSALCEAYGCHSEKGLLQAAQERGLAALVRELREMEEVIDPDGRRFARFKRSDDATAILGRIAD